ncbi:MAG: hypothetical protein Q4F07_04730 [Bacteroidales bacterium]|nr:hypothetical protein [Bacteroidales bacterium]
MADVVIVEKQSKGMAVAALVLGICAAVLFWVPFLNWILIILGIVFGIVGIVKKQGAMAIVGLILSVVALLLPWIILGGVGAALS